MLKMALSHNHKEIQKFLKPNGNLHQNVILSSLPHCQHLLKISLKFVHNFSRYFVKKRNARKNTTSLVKVINEK